MIGEIDIHGVFVAPLLVWMLITWAATWVFRRVLAAFGAYRLIWYPALFDLALFVLVLGGVVAITSGPYRL